MLPEKVQERIAAGEDYVIRFLTPPDEKLHLLDTVRGRETHQCFLDGIKFFLKVWYAHLPIGQYVMTI